MGAYPGVGTSPGVGACPGHYGNNYHHHHHLLTNRASFVIEIRPSDKRILPRIVKFLSVSVAVNSSVVCEVDLHVHHAYIVHFRSTL